MNLILYFGRYMYTDSINLDPNNVMFVWYIAKKYMLSTLIDKCSDFLKDYLSPENAATLLDQGLFFDDSDLVTMCMRQIRRNPVQILSSQCFTEISQSTLDHILDLETMDIDEIEIFKACKKWAEHKCRENEMAVTGPNMRSALGTSLQKIRFPLIPTDVFAKEVAETNILSEIDELRLFRYMCSGEHNKKDDLTYPDKERFRTGQQIKLYSDMDDIEIVRAEGGLVHTLELEISDDINVEGLFIYDPALMACGTRQHIPNLTISAQVNGRCIGQIIGYMEPMHGNPNFLRFSWNYGKVPKGFYTMTVHFWISVCSQCRSQNPYTKRNFSYCDKKGCRNNLLYQGLVSGFKSNLVELDDGLVSVKIRNKKSCFMPIVGVLYSL